ncbi:WcaG Nucleoside-diphosphate-sugar epimerases [uncultured Caudovirales phage]|uniref:WcaG Nucleoside-diphosphate-sugar epimerases n=1 Tax=uncultured Caudovirales phage TaxID=2100421 RepID=A0A6J5LF52_9CAUD|nr:WcaG Nucleoside-diphosphate-sugar epimerases [uncultured Caudovirales phage]
MKIFITGSTGFVGQNLVDYYAKRGHEIYAFRRGESLHDCLDKFKPDAIINSAAEIYDPELMFEPNIVMVQTILEYVRHCNQYCKMIQIGSSSEYGPTDHSTAEDDLLKPIDYYQATKGAATLMCQGWARFFALPIWIVRPYSVYGAGEREHRLFPRLYRAFTHDESMTLYQGHHDFIYINDFVRGIDMVLQEWNLEPGEIINFGSGFQTSNFDLYDKWVKVTGNKEAPVAKVAEMKKAFENTVWVCDTAKSSELGFDCEYDLETGIRDFLLKANYD